MATRKSKGEITMTLDTFIGQITTATEHCMIAEAAHRNLVLYECDVRAAYTTAAIDRELYYL